MIRRIVIFLDRFHWLWLALAAPFMLFSSPMNSLAMLVVPGLFLLRLMALRGNQQTVWRKTQIPTNDQPYVMPSNPLNAALLLLILMLLVSLWTTFDIKYSLPTINGLVLGLGIFFAIVREGQTSRGWWICFLLFLGVGFGIALIGLLGTNWITKFPILSLIVSHLAPRITGLSTSGQGFHPNYMAGALLWVIPSFLAFSCLLLITMKDVRSLLGRGRTITIVMLTIGVTLWTMAIFILTQSRDGYISLALTLPALFMISLPRRRRWYGFALLVLLAIYLGILLASQWGTVRIWIAGDSVSPGTGLSLESITGRLEVWSRAIYGIQDFPLTGMGMNTFRKVMPVLYPSFIIPPNLDIGHAHNEFLQAALDLGIPGLIAFIALYVIAFWMLIRTWHNMRINVCSSSFEKHSMVPFIKSGELFSEKATSLLTNASLFQTAILGLGGGLLAHMLWGLADAMPLGARPASLFWVILGLISGLHQQAQKLPIVGKGSGTLEVKHGLHI